MRKRIRKLRGYRTLLLSAAMAILPGLIEAMGAINWNDYFHLIGVPEKWVVPTAILIPSVIMGLMRFATSTPVFVNGDEPSASDEMEAEYVECEEEESEQ